MLYHADLILVGNANRNPAFLVLVLTTIIGLAIGIAIIYIQTIIERRSRWEQLDSPPGEIVRLITADSDKVIVETADETIYRVSCRAEDPDEVCWNEEEFPEYTDVFPCRNERFPPPPGEAREIIQTCFEYEYTIRSQYALLEDGSLWRWEASIYTWGQVVRAFWTVVISVVLGVIVGIVLLVGMDHR